MFLIECGWQFPGDASTTVNIPSALINLKKQLQLLLVCREFKYEFESRLCEMLEVPSLLCHNSVNFSPAAHYSNDSTALKLDIWIHSAKCHYPFPYFLLKLKALWLWRPFHFIFMPPSLLHSFFTASATWMSLSTLKSNASIFSRFCNRQRIISMYEIFSLRAINFR